VQGVLSFSIVAYLITFTNLVMSRTDQAIISFALGVGAIALYQAGYKAAEMFGLFSVQMQDALTPAAAQLHARRDEAGLRDLLLRSMQLTLLLCLPLYAVCAVYLEPLVRVLTGLPSLEPQTWAVGQALLLATCSSLVTNSCAKRVMMMCGWERKLLKLSLADAGCNLVASLLLVKPLGVLGIALGTMVPTVLIGWLWMTPLTARFMNTSVWSLIASVVRPIALPVGAALLVLGALAWFAPLSPGAGFAGCVWRGAVVAIVQLALGWPILKRLRASG
jgi:O-antigen/teichoic acid export membrane protein